MKKAEIARMERLGLAGLNAFVALGLAAGEGTPLYAKAGILSFLVGVGRGEMAAETMEKFSEELREKGREGLEELIRKGG